MPQIGTIEIGDMVNFDRVFYSHWGVYIGLGKVVHFGLEGNEKNSIKCFFDKNQIPKFRKDELSEVAGEDFYCADNYLDAKYRPRTISEICNYAEKRLKKPLDWEYNPIWRNCEKFAIDCRYGVLKVGRQVETVGKVGAAIGIGAAIGVGVFCLSKMLSATASGTEIEEKSDDDED